MSDTYLHIQIKSRDENNYIRLVYSYQTDWKRYYNTTSACLIL